MQINSYEAKQEARRQRLEGRAERLSKEGHAKVDQAKAMASVIPFGQPILVGHHSEKRDRNYRGKIRSKFEKGFETLKAAAEVAARAAAVGTGGISSDDPDAIEKLRAELAQREAKQVLMAAANTLIRKGDVAGLVELVGEKMATALRLPGQVGGMGFAHFQLSNNSANIRRIKARIADLERNAKRVAKEIERPDGTRIVENVEANRLQIFFPGKPAGEIRGALKQAGFRWSPSEGAWQRQLTNSARYQAEYALSQIGAANG